MKTIHKRRFPMTLGMALWLCWTVSGTTTAAAAAIQPLALNDVMIFDEGLNSGWENWSWDSSIVIESGSFTYSGNKMLSVQFTAPWAGLYFHSNRLIQKNDFVSLRFWIHGGAKSGRSIEVVLIDGNFNEFRTPNPSIPLAANVWTEIEIPLSRYGNFNTVSGFYWHDLTGAAQPPFYLDRVILIGAGDLLQPTPTPIPILTPTPKPVGAIASKWDLWSNGTMLRGANIYQRRVFPELDGPTFLGPGPMGPPYTQQDFDRLAECGANVVIVSHSGLFTVDPPYALDARIQANLDQLLTKIANANMFAVISFRGGPGRSDFALFYWDGLDPKFFNDSVWNSQSAQDAWVEMWRYTAERYKNNPVVVGYDLMVEPNSNFSGSNYFTDRKEMWDPNVFYAQYGGTLYDWNQLYPRITEAIRRVDPKTPLLIGGNSYSSVAWLPYVAPTDDLYTVYTVHHFEPFDAYTHKHWSAPDFASATYPGFYDIDYDGAPEQFNKAWLNVFLSPVDQFKSLHNKPVAVNEFGVARWANQAAAYINDQMELFEDRGMNHMIWLWESSWAPMASEDMFNFRHGSLPSNHTDVPTSDLIETIKRFWGRNQVRPSQVSFPPVGIADFMLYD